MSKTPTTRDEPPYVRDRMGDVWEKTENGYVWKPDGKVAMGPSSFNHVQLHWGPLKTVSETHAELAQRVRNAAKEVVPAPVPDVPEEVSHPAHYTGRNVACRECSTPIECIQVSETFGFNLGNVVKYVWRAGAKGDRLQDLQKAAQYLEFEIAREKRERAAADAMKAAGEWDGIER